MIALRLRGKTYHADFLTGRVHTLRGSLGTHNHDAALRLAHRLETALSEGTQSSLWTELSTVLPERTFFRFAQYVGVKPRRVLTWPAFLELFESDMNLRGKTGELAANTVDAYHRVFSHFNEFVHDQGIKLLRDIDAAVIDRYPSWRIVRLKPRKHSCGKSTLALERNYLHTLFAFAMQRQFIESNPVYLVTQTWDPNSTTRPFCREELQAMRAHAGRDQFLFLLLRWTGLRRSDVVRLTWQEVNFEQKEIEHVCQKNRKRINVPINEELLSALLLECRRGTHSPEDPVLDPKSLNGNTGFGFSRGPEPEDEPFSERQLYLRRRLLYGRIEALGKRASVRNAHPHRFRSTFAVDLLMKGVHESMVAKILGDTVGTVIKYYLPFVKELRDRARVLMNCGQGIEELVTPASQHLGC